jgi:hypothetical protein
VSRIGKVVTEISAEGCGLVISQTDTIISEKDAGRVSTRSTKIDGVAVETVTSVISEEAKHNIARTERRELLRKIHLIDESDLARRLLEGKPLHKHERAFLADLVKGKKRPAHRPREVDTALRRDEMAELCLWLKALRPDLPKEQIKQVVARHFGVHLRSVSTAVSLLSPRRRRAFEEAIADHGLRSRGASEAK